MDIILSAIAFIIIFSLLVLIHEWGHFFTARRAGIKVEEFGFGLPPRIWGVKRKGVLYSLNAIPFGGFVKLLGEDSSDPHLAKDKKSFISKPPRIRMLVVCAGVLMNFLLAFLLLTIGFIFGIKPLILDSKDLFQNIQQGQLILEQGLTIKEVVNGSPADDAGIQSKDRILEVDSKPIIAQEQLQLFDPKKNINDAVVHTLLLEREGETLSIEIVSENNDLGIRLYQNLFLPRLSVAEIIDAPLLAEAGLKKDDTILEINDIPIYFEEDLVKNIQGGGLVKFSILRNAEIKNFEVEFPRPENLIISKVVPGSPAEDAGLRESDYIVSINGEEVSTLDSLSEKLRENVNTPVEVKINRYGDVGDIDNCDVLASSVLAPARDQGYVCRFTVERDKNGLLGISYSFVNYLPNTGLAFYQTDVPASIIEMKDVQYPFWEAPGKALQEIGRLSVLTVETFAGTIRSLITKLSVPDGISGPVGIAHMTYIFVQEGFLSLIRFAALLSISLAIINVLPIPALDGGRLFFIIVEVLRGKRIDGKLEAIIHAIGFLLLLLFIFFLVYNDIVRLIF